MEPDENEKSRLPFENNPTPAYHSILPAPNVVQPQPVLGQVVSVIVARRPPAKSLTEAYLLWFPLGVLGLHHFYLRRWLFGFLYLFTGGLAGIGWLVDAFRMPWLVRTANSRIEKGTTEDEEDLSLSDAYVLWFPLGFLGLHHYYLRRPAWGVLYTFTGGLFLVGWLVDAFRLPCLVTEVNQRRALERLQRGGPVQKSLCEAYAFGITPAGIFGAHHFYLGRPIFGVYYLLTLGGGGIGWIIDWFRMAWLVERANNPSKYLLGSRHKFVDDAYVLAFPFGVLGLHHFYLESFAWGILYFFTLGLFGVGWLFDLCRMPCLVAAANERLANELCLMEQVRQELRVGPGQTIIVTRPQDVVVQPSYPVQPTGQHVLQVNGHVPSAMNTETPVLYPPSYTESVSNQLPPVEPSTCIPYQPPSYNDSVKVETYKTDVE